MFVSFLFEANKLFSPEHQTHRETSEHGASLQGPEGEGQRKACSSWIMNCAYEETLNMKALDPWNNFTHAGWFDMGSTGVGEGPPSTCPPGGFQINDFCDDFFNGLLLDFFSGYVFISIQFIQSKSAPQLALGLRNRGQPRKSSLPRLVSSLIAIWLQVKF